MYLPYVFRSFQGFTVKDLRESIATRHMVIVLKPKASRRPLCRRCGNTLGRKRGEYWVEAKHLKAFGWTSSVRFPVAKCECSTCGCIRSELIEFIYPTSPHCTVLSHSRKNSTIRESKDQIRSSRFGREPRPQGSSQGMVW